eukprot:14940350-Ditylum_brightwellii.AAC.1
MEKIPQSKGGGGLLYDGEVRALMVLCTKPGSPKDKITLSQIKWENILRHQNVNREEDEVYWEERAIDVDGFVSTKKTLSHERKRKLLSICFSACDEGNSCNLVYEEPYAVLYDEQSQSSQSLGALPNTNQVLCSVESMETAETEGSNIDEMDELGVQASRALSFKPSS